MADLTNIAKGPQLRAAINTGNRALVQQGADGALHGVSPALARALAARLGLPLEPVVYDGAGKVFADAGRDIWDVAFMAVDPARATDVSFTRPYHGIEATCAIRAGQETVAPGELDREGLTLLSSAGSAYQLYLSAAFRKATLQIGGTPAESFAAFKAGAGDAVAGIRASLERHLGDDAEIVILPGTLTRVDQAMVLPGPANPAIKALDAFVAEALDSGLVADALDTESP